MSGSDHARAQHRHGWLLLCAILLLSSLRGAPAGAQQEVPWIIWPPTPGLPRVVLVHGGNADSTTWSPFGAELYADGFNVFTPTLDRSAPVGSQAAVLSSRMAAHGDNIPDVMIAAHSQGGLVARALARGQPVRSLITVGTPHQGMAIAKNTSRIDWWVTTTVFDVVAVDGIVPNAGMLFDEPDYDPYEYTSMSTWERRTALVFAIELGTFLITAGDIYLNTIWGSLASWDELAPGSLFLQELNANVSQERVDHAYSLMVEEGTGYLGGPLRLFVPGPVADGAGELMYMRSAVCEMNAYSLLEGAWQSPEPWLDTVGAIGLLDLAGKGENFGLWWTQEIIEGFPHDGLVVQENQFRPSSVAIRLHGMAHTEETDKARPDMHIRLSQDRP